MIISTKKNLKALAKFHFNFFVPSIPIGVSWEQNERRELQIAFFEMLCHLRRTNSR
jgi:hypothetical protein